MAKAIAINKYPTDSYKWVLGGRGFAHTYLPTKVEPGKEIVEMLCGHGWTSTTKPPAPETAKLCRVCQTTISHLVVCISCKGHMKNRNTRYECLDCGLIIPEFYYDGWIFHSSWKHIKPFQVCNLPECILVHNRYTEWLRQR